jgi:hypothetical protein
MDLLAVKECTDTRFLPGALPQAQPRDVNARIERLKDTTGDSPQSAPSWRAKATGVAADPRAVVLAVQMSAR